MSTAERDMTPTEDRVRQLELDVPSLSVALQSSPEERLDRHLGRGVAFPLGQKTELELFPQVVRISAPDAQIAIRRREPKVSPEGVVFEQADRFFLSVGPTGDVLFQYSPEPVRAAETGETAARSPLPSPESSPPVRDDLVQPRLPSASPPPEQKEPKAKSERYVGRMGEVRTHTTKAGKLVAEVEVTVPDPDRPGASKLVKFAAFGDMAKALRDNYQPGQEVTAVGIPHELKRRNKDGAEWTERQLYFVQPPKPR